MKAVSIVWYSAAMMYHGDDGCMAAYENTHNNNNIVVFGTCMQCRHHPAAWRRESAVKWSNENIVTHLRYIRFIGVLDHDAGFSGKKLDIDLIKRPSVSTVIYTPITGHPMCNAALQIIVVPKIIHNIATSWKCRLASLNVIYDCVSHIYYSIT